MTTAVEKSGSFTLLGNHVFLGYSLLLYHPSNEVAVLSTTVRNKVPMEEQADLDEMLFNIKTKGGKIEYVVDLKDKFNPDKEIENYLKSENFADNIIYNDTYQLGLTDEEITAAIEFNAHKKAYDERVASIKEKIKTKFQEPRIPYTVSASVDIDKIYGAEADKVKQWMNDPNLTSGNVNVTARPKGNVVRVSRNETRIESLSGYHLGMRTCQKLCEAALSKWREGFTDYEKRNLGYGSGTPITVSARIDHRVCITEDTLNVGCQGIPRSEVERLAVLRGWA